MGMAQSIERLQRPIVSRDQALSTAGVGFAVDGTLSLSVRPAGWTLAKLGRSVRRLGAGTGGHVDLHYSQDTGKAVAVKTLPAGLGLGRRVLEELAIAATVRHANVVRTLDVILESDRQCYVVMEACSADLLSLTRNGITRAQATGYFGQLVQGVQHLHRIGVAHRDLKLDNVCVTDTGVVKIVDFGCATLFRRRHTSVRGGTAEYVETLSVGLCGSDPYMAPELFGGRPYAAAKADVWALGIIFFAVHHLQFPWAVAQPRRDTRYREYAEQPSGFLDTWFCALAPSCSQGDLRARGLAGRMLEPSADRRADIDDIAADRLFFQPPE
ncbi:serine/threonine protein kinase [Coemansia sp. Benny D115]|nr:serine/threonine protein kinase [Coemansia sp. Benny D115]